MKLNNKILCGLHEKIEIDHQTLINDFLADYDLVENQDGSYDCMGDLFIYANSRLSRFINKNRDGFTIKFRNIKGDFKIDPDTKMSDLKNGPDKVGGDFILINNSHIKTLVNGPKEVGGRYRISNNKNLTSLKGCPKVVGAKVKKVVGDYDAVFNCESCSNLTSLEGCPEIINGTFKCSFCSKLDSFKGGPKEVRGNILCYQSALTSLEGMPQKVTGFIEMYRNTKQIKSFKGCTKKILGDMTIENVSLNVDLSEGPKEIVDCVFGINFSKKPEKADRKEIAEKIFSTTKFTGDAKLYINGNGFKPKD